MFDDIPTVEDADAYDEYVQRCFIKPFSKISCIRFDKKLKKMISKDQVQSLIRETVQHIKLDLPQSRAFEKKFVVNATGLAGLFGKKKETTFFALICLSNDATEDNELHNLQVSFRTESFQKIKFYDCFVDYKSLSLEQNIIIATEEFYSPS